MITYCTVSTNPSWHRQFRSYSCKDRLAEMGLSTTYGEWEHRVTVSKSELDAAPVIAPGEKQGGTMNGTNKDSKNGYAVFDGEYTHIFFITNTNYGNTKYYRYRDRSTTSTTYYRYRDRTKVPTVYHFYKDIYEDIMKDEISGMTLVVEK